jgi:lysyl-tRNA synthetase class I
MDYSDDQNNGRLNDIEDGVREPIEKSPPEGLVYEWIQLRVLEDIRVDSFQLDSEPNR